MFDVISFGSAVLDIFLDTGLREKGKFMAYPVGEKLQVRDMEFYIGGGGTNTAVAFSRLGLKTGYLGKIADDFSGKKILENLKKEKVEFLGVFEKGSKGGYSIILDSKEKDRTVLTYKGVNEEIKFSEINLKKLKTKWIYLSSFLGRSFETEKRLAKKLYSQGVKIAFNRGKNFDKRKGFGQRS